MPSSASFSQITKCKVESELGAFSGSQPARNCSCNPGESLPLAAVRQMQVHRAATLARMPVSHRSTLFEIQQIDASTANGHICAISGQCGVKAAATVLTPEATAQIAASAVQNSKGVKSNLSSCQEHAVLATVSQYSAGSTSSVQEATLPAARSRRLACHSAAERQESFASNAAAPTASLPPMQTGTTLATGAAGGNEFGRAASLASVSRCSADSFEPMYMRRSSWGLNTIGGCRTREEQMEVPSATSQGGASTLPLRVSASSSLPDVQLSRCFSGGNAWDDLSDSVGSMVLVPLSRDSAVKRPTRLSSDSEGDSSGLSFQCPGDSRVHVSAILGLVNQYVNDLKIFKLMSQCPVGWPSDGCSKQKVLRLYNTAAVAVLMHRLRHWREACPVRTIEASVLKIPTPSEVQHTMDGSLSVGPAGIDPPLAAPSKRGGYLAEPRRPQDQSIHPPYAAGSGLISLPELNHTPILVVHTFRSQYQRHWQLLAG